MLPLGSEEGSVGPIQCLDVCDILPTMLKF